MLVRTYIRLFPAVIAPFIGPYLARNSKQAFDAYEIFSFLILPVLYLAIGHFFGERRLPRIEAAPRSSDYQRYRLGYKITFYTALWLLVFYQISVTIILSPGGPEGAQELFWVWFTVFFLPYLALIGVSEHYVIKARRALRSTTIVPNDASDQYHPDVTDID